jgi:polyphosphate:AMP phosphotransferase
MLDAAQIGHQLEKVAYDKAVPDLREALIEAQYQLLQSRRFATLVLLSGVNAAGKSETANRLLAWMDPRFIETHAIGRDESEEQRLHPFMWRYWQVLPPKGRITIFFESWYNAPVAEHLLGQTTDAEFEQRLAEINRFERMLTDEGVLLLKYHLHISKKQQRRRLKRLADDPNTSWRISEEDELSIKFYRPLCRDIEELLRLTSHGHAPWVVVEAGDRRYRELVVGQSMLRALRDRLNDAEAPRSRRATAKVEVEPPDGRSVLSTLDFASCIAPSRYADKLAELQARLARLTRDKRFAKRSLVIAFEGVDAAGKGGTIRRVAQAIDPKRSRIVPIAKPTDEEAARPYLWRFWRQIPRRGRVAIFDRSWYGRVLVERVEGFCSSADWQRAYREINDFESDLTSDGVILAKFWLAISKKEQLQRFKMRERLPFKRFKITEEDWRNRERWQDYEWAVHDMIARTSTDLSPWTLVEAEDKSFAHLKVLRTLCERIEARL